MNVSGTSNLVTVSANTLSVSKINFQSSRNQYKINLWGVNKYGFGIGSSTLMYSSQSFHSFYCSSNNLNTFSIDSTGNCVCNGGLTICNSNSYPNLQLGSINGHNLGICTPTAGGFSSSAALGDMVLRSINKLVIQSGQEMVLLL
jgi:hypothetical protein